MPDKMLERRKHFVLKGRTETQKYRPPHLRFPESTHPPRERATHGSSLMDHLQELRSRAAVVRETHLRAGIDEGRGIQLEFMGFPSIDLAFESLSRERFGIELLNVRKQGVHIHATVFVPDGKLVHFEKLIRDYLEEKRDILGRLRDNHNLIETIQNIRAATLEELWTDDRELLPSDDEEPIWWEAWLPVRRNREQVVEALRLEAGSREFQVAQGQLEFPERTVVLLHGCSRQIKDSVIMLNNIAELRRAKETAEFFHEMRVGEQSEWLDELLSRTRFAPDGTNVPYVCLLDTGVSRDHPFLSDALVGGDMHSCVPAWGSNDADGHGTRMAGLAIAGNLTDALDGNERMEIDHRLESVKLLPRGGSKATATPHYGYRTKEAVARPEVKSPLRKRVFAMMTSALDQRDRGRPSAWSASLDSLAAGDGTDGNRRLLVVAAGNVLDPAAWINSPTSNATDGIHDPGQAWNVLTVGAHTDLVRIAESEAYGQVPIAERGGLSPFSTTSATWEAHWPLKPDIVLEGGNASKDRSGATVPSSLSLLTTHHNPDQDLFATANATSASTALASRLAAQVMAMYPDLWPETIRALIVHSAEWTETMKRTLLPNSRAPSKSNFVDLVRRCGFGVPNLDRALWSISHSLTMVTEEHLTPFKREDGRDVSFRDMHYHKLPWPVNALLELGSKDVEMRVTLSYFIEPNPSRRGVTSRYRYQSHGLRFDMKRSTESVTEFRKRINGAARPDGESNKTSSDDPDWLIGSQGRLRGSIHADIWRGSAIDLASRGQIAIYPSTGWWKTRPAQKRYGESVRYALVVSIRTSETDVDLYTEVANLIASETGIEV